MQKDDDDVGILNAILTNTANKIFFGGLDPDDAQLIDRVLNTGNRNHAEWKPGSERPVAVGSEKSTVANWSHAQMESYSEMRAHSRSHAHGSGFGTTSSAGTSSGTGTGAGATQGQVLTPPFQTFGPNGPNTSIIPVPLSQSVGQSSAQSSFAQTSESSGETHSEFDMESESETEAFGISRGTSRSNGGSEVFVTRYEWLPSTMYTLAEQQERSVGELMNLPPREVLVKIRGAPPFRARTADVPPAFRSAEFKQFLMPLYRAAALARSPYIRSADEVDAELAARSALPLPPMRKSEPDSWGEPIDYPDPPPPPDAPRGKPKLRIVGPDSGAAE